MAQRKLQKHQEEDELINESTPGWLVCLEVPYKIALLMVLKLVHFGICLLNRRKKILLWNCGSKIYQPI